MEVPGNPNAARMNFTIPREKPILISIANAYAAVDKKDASFINKKRIYEKAKGSVDALVDKSLAIDDVDMSDNAIRIRSDFFDLDGGDGEEEKIAITDGHWLALPPGRLTPGKHKIYRSSCNNVGTHASTDYVINIV